MLQGAIRHQQLASRTRTEAAIVSDDHQRDAAGR
jgi:hypothetical protein